MRDLDQFCDEHAKLRRGELSSLHPSEPRAALPPDRLAVLRTFAARLCEALQPLAGIKTSEALDFSTVAGRHRAVLEALSRDENGTARAFESMDGEALAKAFDDLAATGTPSGLTVSRADYPETFKTLFADRMVRRPQTDGATLRIYGPLEARLTQCDRVILGGLVEGVWPPAPRIDPWLSRPMRHDLGVDLPERRIGLSAHDFAQLLGTKEVILTHAAKIGGAPADGPRFFHPV